jgi:hypothetical protein
LNVINARRTLMNVSALLRASSSAAPAWNRRFAQIDCRTANSHVDADVAFLEDAVHGGPHRRDFLPRFQLHRNGLARWRRSCFIDRASNFLVPFLNGELSRRQLSLSAFRCELSKIDGLANLDVLVSGHRRSSSSASKGTPAAHHILQSSM